MQVMTQRLWELQTGGEGHLEQLLARDVHSMEPFSVWLHAGTVLVVDLTAETVTACRYPFSPSLKLVFKCVEGVEGQLRAPYAARTWGIAWARQGLIRAVQSVGGDAALFAAEALEGAELTAPGEGRRWWEYLTSGTGLWLPRLQQCYDEALAGITATAALAQGRGEHAPRTPASLANRTKTFLLAQQVAQQLQRGEPLSWHQHRTLVMRTAREAHGKGRVPKAPWSNIPQMLRAGGMDEMSSSRWDWQRAEPLPCSPGHLPFVNTEFLVEATEAAQGPLADDDPLFTLARALKAGHLPLLSPQFMQTAREARQPHPGGGVSHLQLGTDRDFTPAQWDGLMEVIREFDFHGGKGVFELLTDEQVADGSTVLCSMSVDAVLKGPTRLSEPAARAVAADDMPAMLGEAQVAVGELVVLLESALAAAATQGTLDAKTKGDILRRVLEGYDPPATKTRLVVEGGPLVRGSARLGLAKEAVRKWRFAYDTWPEVLEGLRHTDVIAKYDLASWFYCIGYHPSFYPFCVIRALNPYTKKLVYWRMRRLAMGLTDSCGLSQTASTWIGQVAALSAAADPRFPHAAMAHQDDYMLKMAPAHEAQQHAAITRTLLAASSVPGVTLESEKKRCPASARQTIQGCVVDLPRGLLDLPAESKYRYLRFIALVDAMLAHPDPALRGLVGGKVMEILVGYLGWWSTATAVGTAHLSTLYGLQRQRTLSGEDHAAVRATLAWWLGMARQGRLRAQSILRLEGSPMEHRAPKVQYSDAGERAIAATHEGWAVWRLLREEELEASSKTREVAGISLGLRTFGHLYTRHSLIIFTDSEAAACAIAKGNLPPAEACYTEEMHAAAERYDFHYYTYQWPRELNLVADELSKATTWEEALAVASRHGLTLAQG